MTFKNFTLLSNFKDVKRGIVLHNIDFTKYKFPVVFDLKVITAVKSVGIVGAKTTDFE
jgi:hypothetical protein